jgi:hypothetical protein
MIPYDEGQAIGFIDDATAIYRTAHASVNPHALVWVARMQFDAGSLGYAASRSKHLHELWVALGRIGPEPIVIDPDPLGPAPPNIRTENHDDVDARVTWWLTYYGHLTVADHDYWMGIIFDTLYHEGHAIGWTADSYWPDLMRDAYTRKTLIAGFPRKATLVAALLLPAELTRVVVTAEVADLRGIHPVNGTLSFWTDPRAQVVETVSQDPRTGASIRTLTIGVPSP